MELNETHVVIAWQSLVVESYRSFFTQLAKETGVPLSLISPDSFIEAGNQKIKSRPFGPPFDGSVPDCMAFELSAVVPHVQAVWYRNLAKALKNIRVKYPEKRALVICLAEPFSLTAFLFRLVARHVFGKSMLFACFTLQNIKLKLGTALASIQNSLFRHSDFILSLGKEQTEVLRENGYGGPVVNFPLWYESKRFFPQDQNDVLAFSQEHGLESNRGAVRIAYSGSLFPEKGLDDLFDALVAKADEWKHRVTMAIVGRGHYQAEVERRVAELVQLGYRVKMVGSLAHSQMATFFSWTELLVVPSRTMERWKEQFGRVIPEAQACGALVCGSSSGAIPEVIGDTRLVFLERNPSDLARVVDFALAEIERRDDRVGGRKVAGGNYSDEQTAKAFSRALKEVLKGIAT